MRGTNEKKKGSCLKTCLIVVAVLVILGVIGSSMRKDDDTPKKVAKDTTEANNDTSNEKPKEEPAKEEPAQTSFAVGETAELNGVQVTLTSVTESTGSEFIKPDEGNIFLLCQFEIANNSEKDINISSIANFEAYCDDYSINQDLVGLQAPENEGKNQLDGSVAAGKKMSGVISYQVPVGWSSLEVNVSPDFWSSKDIKFIATK